MLSLDVMNKKALPIRALPFVTSGVFNPLDVITLLCSPENHMGGDLDRPIIGYRLGPDEAPQPIYPTEFDRFQTAISLAHESGTPVLELTRLLPPGVFVWLDEMKSFFDFICAQREAIRQRIEGRERFGDDGWNESPFLTPEEEQCIHDGFTPKQDSQSNYPGAQRIAETDQTKATKPTASETTIAAILKLISEIQTRATDKNEAFDPLDAPGRSKDLHQLAQEWGRMHEERKLTLSISSFDRYRKKIIAFRKGSRKNDFYRRMFPEFF